MKYFSIIILVFVFLISCQMKSNPTNSHGTGDSAQVQNIKDSNIQSKSFDNDKYKSHRGLDFAKTNDKINDLKNILTIDKVCAISLEPDTNWTNNQQKEMSESDYNTVVMDNITYRSLAIDTLKKLGIPNFAALRDKRFLKFIKSNGTEFLIDLNKMPDSRGLILFNGIDNPVLWNSDSIDDEINEIYKK
jgi:hypothetical protein